MRRLVKNIIMIFVILIMFGANFLVMNRLKENDYNSKKSKLFEIDEKGETDTSSIDDVDNKDKKIDKIYYVVFLSLDGGIAVVGVYLVMSRLNRKNFTRFISKPKRVVIYLVVTIGVTCLLMVANILATKQFFLNTKAEDIKINRKKVVKFELDLSNVVDSTNIDLTNYNNNIVIEKAGEYNFSGSFNKSIIVNSSGDVILNFKDVVVSNKETAALIGLKADSITIKTLKDTISSFSDFGDTDYSGAIYSNVPIIFEGDGVLKVSGKNSLGSSIYGESLVFNGGSVIVDSQYKGIKASKAISIHDGLLYVKATSNGMDAESITVDGGTSYIMAGIGIKSIKYTQDFVINDGLFIATGYGDVEPKREGSQNVMIYNFDDEVSWGTPIALKSVTDNLAIAFKAESDFKSLIISSREIAKDKYNLIFDAECTGILDRGIYYDGKCTAGKKVKLGETDIFEVINKRNFFGKRTEINRNVD